MMMFLILISFESIYVRVFIRLNFLVLNWDSQPQIFYFFYLICVDNVKSGAFFIL